MRVVRTPLALSTVLCSALLLHTVSARGQEAQKPAASKTKVVLLGAGNPGPDPDRSGPAHYPRPFVVGRDLDVY